MVDLQSIDYFCDQTRISEYCRLWGYLALQDGSDFSMGELLAFFYMRICSTCRLRSCWAQPFDRSRSRLRKRVFEVLDSLIEVDEPAEPKSLPSGLIEVEFDHVTFEYPGRPAVLDRFNLTLSANSDGPCGPYGRGKVDHREPRHAQLRFHCRKSPTLRN